MHEIIGTETLHKHPVSIKDQSDVVFLLTVVHQIADRCEIAAPSKI
jgi:hypothetical protein